MGVFSAFLPVLKVKIFRSFEIPEDSECRFFACQNPRAQGGNRRALPKSFINRFVNIHVDNYTAHDMEMIITRQLAGFGRGGFEISFWNGRF